MSKVKLTQEQADVFERVVKEYEIDDNLSELIEKHSECWCYPPNQILNNITTYDFARLVVERDYEVEPQFQVGDVVMRYDNKLGTVIRVDTNSYTTNDLEVVEFHEIRHATPLEKQLFELGRTEPKLKEGDVVELSETWTTGDTTEIYKSYDICSVTNGEEATKTYLNNNKIKHIYPIEHRIELGDNQEPIDRLKKEGKL